MSYLFPYRSIEKSSKVILYGAGVVGKDFMLQINATEYCQLVAWVDKGFDGYEVEAPFDYVSNIMKYSFDYIVVAVINRKVGEDIVEYLRSIGIPEKKIVWTTASYITAEDQFPVNKKIYLKNFYFFQELYEEYLKANTIYGLNKFYESYYELGIPGVRNTNERLAIYKIHDFLSVDDEVLDIGCNCGFLDMQVAPFVKHITGIDIENTFIDIANKVKTFMGINNCDFICDDFYKHDVNRKFDAIFSFAVHSNLMLSGASAQEYVDRLYELLNYGGHIFFESHNMRNDAKRFRDMCDMFLQKGLKLVLSQNYFAGFDRDIVVFEKCV